jgi:hypothetical protein
MGDDRGGKGWLTLPHYSRLYICNETGDVLVSIVKGNRASGAGDQVQWLNTGSSRKLASFADRDTKG